MEYNKSELKRHTNKAIALSIKQLLYSIIFQVNFVIVIILFILRIKNKDIYILASMIIVMLMLIISWCNVIIVSIKSQEFISKASHSLITAGLCPFVGHLVSSIITFNFVKNKTPEEYLYNDSIRHNIRNIEALKFEIEEDFKNGLLTKSEYKDRQEKITKIIKQSFKDNIDSKS